MCVQNKGKSFGEWMDLVSISYNWRFYLNQYRNQPTMYIDNPICFVSVYLQWFYSRTIGKQPRVSGPAPRATEISVLKSCTGKERAWVSCDIVTSKVFCTIKTADHIWYDQHAVSSALANISVLFVLSNSNSYDR